MGDDSEKSAVQDHPDAVGHVVVDSRGRNVWQWDDEQLDSTSILLKRLDNDALAIEPTRRVPIHKADGAKTGRSGR